MIPYNFLSNNNRHHSIHNYFLQLLNLKYEIK